MDIDSYQEWRDDMLQEAREDYEYEKSMKNDYDFFIKNSNYRDLLKEIEYLKKMFDDYEWEWEDIREEIEVEIL